MSGAGSQEMGDQNLADVAAQSGGYSAHPGVEPQRVAAADDRRRGEIVWRRRRAGRPFQGAGAPGIGLGNGPMAQTQSYIDQEDDDADRDDRGANAGEQVHAMPAEALGVG